MAIYVIMWHRYDKCFRYAPNSANTPIFVSNLIMMTKEEPSWGSQRLEKMLERKDRCSVNNFPCTIIIIRHVVNICIA